ncbi:MAG: DUF6118 family protein [Janthinobacterium lividum]
MDGRGQGHLPEDEADAHQEDGAERAFEALCEEVAALRRGMELVYRQIRQVGQPTAVAGPDYTLTLARMEKALGTVAGRLEAVERQPALQMMTARLGVELDAAARDAASTVSASAHGLIGEMGNATRTLADLVGRVHDRREQRARLWMAGGCGVLGGMLLWFMLAALLPWGAGDWLASLPIDRGGPWAAGETLLDRVSPQSWDRMKRLYEACGEQPTALCEAAIAVRIMPTPAPEQTKGGSVVTPGRALHRSQAGQSGQ